MQIKKRVPIQPAESLPSQLEAVGQDCVTRGGKITDFEKLGTNEVQVFCDLPEEKLSVEEKEQIPSNFRRDVVYFGTGVAGKAVFSDGVEKLRGFVNKCKIDSGTTQIAKFGAEPALEVICVLPTKIDLNKVEPMA